MQKFILWFSHFFPHKTSIPRSIYKVPGKDAETYSECNQTSKMEFFAVIVNEFYPLTIFAKSSILDVPLGSEYTFGIFSLSWMKMFAIALMVKLFNQLNCQNGLFSWEMQLFFFLTHTNILIWKMLTSK